MPPLVFVAKSRRFMVARGTGTRRGIVEPSAVDIPLAGGTNLGRGDYHEGN
jgi:hypothetical protein